MMQFVVFSLLCQLLASATVSAESTFFNKFDPNPIASTINEHSEGDTFFVSASQEPTRKQLIIKDFASFFFAKDLELFVKKMKPKQKELNVTDNQLNELNQLATQWVSTTERLVFSTVSNRSDQSFVTLRNETEVIELKKIKWYETMAKTLNQNFVPQEYLDTFIEMAEITFNAITEDGSTILLRGSFLNKLDELRTNYTTSFVKSKETEIYHDLCKLDPENIFFQQATKPLVTRLAKLTRLIEQVKAKHYPDYVVMLEYYYGFLVDDFNRIGKENCKTEYPNFHLVEQSKYMENDPILEAFQQKLGIHLTSSSVSSVASRLMVAFGLVAVLFLIN